MQDKTQWLSMQAMNREVTQFYLWSISCGICKQSLLQYGLNLSFIPLKYEVSFIPLKYGGGMEISFLDLASVFFTCVDGWAVL